MTKICLSLPTGFNHGDYLKTEVVGPLYILIMPGSRLSVDGLAQDCGNSTANALELPQSCTKPST